MSPLLSRRPQACWPWEGPLPARFKRPSASPEIEAQEQTMGLVGQVAWGWARLVPQILGPLARDPAVRPLSLARGRLVAAAVSRVPAEHEVWMADVQHIETHDPAVCRALAAEGRSFLVGNQACIDALDEARRAGVALGAVRLASEREFSEVPAIDTDAFLPLVQLSELAWLCWDRDLLRATVRRPQGRSLPGTPVPMGILPFRSRPHPGTPPCHLAARGEGWAAAMHREARGPRLLAGPGERWAVISRGSASEQDLDDAAWLWTHDEDHRTSTRSLVSRGAGSLMAIELHDGKASAWWTGALRAYRLRAGVLVEVAGAGAQGEAVFEVAEGDRVLVSDEATLEALGRERLTGWLAQDLEGGAQEALLALKRGRLEGALLVLSPGAKNTSEPGWTSRLRLSLGSPLVEPIWSFYRDPPDPEPSSWTLHRAHGPGAPDAQAAPARWRDAVANLAQTAALAAAQAGDELRLCSGRERYLFRLGSAGFEPVAWSETKAPSVAAGEIGFAEDALTPGFQAALARASKNTDGLLSLAGVAAAEGLPALALWLRLMAEHREGRMAAGLDLATGMVSNKTRALFSGFGPGSQAEDYELEEDDLLDNPRRYHHCRVSFCALVSEGLERMSVAGAWWNSASRGLSHRDYLAHVRAWWSCDGSARGHMGGWPAEADGLAFPLRNPEPRRIHERDVTPQRMRRNVPLRVTLDLHCGLCVWRWNEHTLRVSPTLTLPELKVPTRYRADVVIARAYGIRLLDVLSLEEPRPIAPGPLANKNEIGDFIEFEGKLSRQDAYWPVVVGMAQREPLRGGELRVVPPELAEHRNGRVDWDAPHMARWSELLARGPVRVRVVGELAYGKVVWATELTLL